MSQSMVPNAGKSNTIQAFLNSDNVKKKLSAVARDFMKPEDLIRMALVAIHRNPQILQCSQASILAALMDAAELRIKPGGMNGRGYLIPRYNKNTRQLECCFDPGWRGLIDIMRRSGEIKRVEAHAVFENDKLKVVYGLNPVFEHEPCLGDERGALVGSYAIAEFRDGGFQVEFLTRGDIAKIRAASTSKSGPWGTWEDEMARKSAARRLSKWLPADAAVDRAAHLAAKADSATIDVTDFDVDIPSDEEAPASGEENAPALPAGRTESLKDQLRHEQARAGAYEQPRMREPGED